MEPLGREHRRRRPDDPRSVGLEPPTVGPAARPRLTDAMTVAQLLGLQRSAGNHAVTRLLRADAAAPAPAEEEAAEEVTTDPAIEALDLMPKVKAAAYALKKKFPEISFTSGKREEVDEQANAMAGNVVSDRNWITSTYTDKTLAAKLQKWVDDNPTATTKDAIANGLAETISAWTDEEKGRLSAHFTGEAFDIQPQTDKADEIKAEANAQAAGSGGRFLEKEGNLIRWHLQIRE